MLYITAGVYITVNKKLFITFTLFIKEKIVFYFVSFKIINNIN